MRVIVDANIVFSGILNSNGKIGDILINSNNSIDFIAPNFLRTEIRNVAYAKHFRCKIWSGDKRLIKGLAKKGYMKFVTTEELFLLRR